MLDTALLFRSWLMAATRLNRLDDRGASLVEYALLLALIAMICFAAVMVLGGQVSTKLSDTGTSVANT